MPSRPRCLKTTLLLCCLALAGQVPCLAQVDAGRAYGANLLAGLFTGAFVGAGAGSISYAGRHNQDPSSIALGAIYGSLGAALGVGLPVSAYQVAVGREGVGTNAFYDVLGFGLIGGVVGAAGGVLSYRNKAGTPQETQAEDFLAAGGAGVCSGALVGLGIGLFEAARMGAVSRKVPGSGIHASIGVLGAWTALPGLRAETPEAALKLAQVNF